MTLVLPYGVEIASTPLFSGSGSSQNSSMPCVFDNDAFERDFESALMRDWATDISDYSLPAEDSPMKTPSEPNDLKRKSSSADSDDASSPSSAKKARFDSDDDPVVPSSSPAAETPTSSFLMDSSSSSASSSSSSSEGGSTEEEEEYLPVRRPQMWSSRQRWKDERKKVLKMSISKLAEIEDPELCLLRSVLINNTIKRLHADIKSERQAKQLRQKAQRMDFFAAAAPEQPQQQQPPYFPKPDFYDDSSCDEIFGIGGEDFLRVEVPDRRVSSPLPSRQSDPPCDTTTAPRTSSPPVTPQPRKPPAVAPPSGGGQQCAMQYRTNRDLRGGFGDVSFPPRVPILDSVVYHSLLASLESS